MTTPRDFYNDLDHSNDYSAILDNLYKELASWVIEVRTITDKAKQLKWIDKEVDCWHWYFTIDEKIRYQDYWDVLLEINSNYERKTLGWTVDDKKVSTYVVFYFVPTDRVVIINYKQLRKVTIEGLKDNWTQRFPYKFAKTSYGNWKYYRTRNIAVPVYVLQELWVHMIFKTNVSKCKKNEVLQRESSNAKDI